MSEMIKHNIVAEKMGCSPLYLSLFCLLYFFLPPFILSCFLILRIGGPALAYWCSLLVLGIMAVCLKEKISFRDILVFVGLIVFSHVFSYVFFDLYHDGLAYHQPAISRIAAGFNPISGGYMDFGRPADLWSDQATYYPKATWYFAASVTAAFGDIQLGKAYQWLLLFASVFFVWDGSRDEHLMKRLLWIIACLNPITLTQIPLYTVDGALASLCVTALFYAQFFYSGKIIPKLVHVIGIIALATLCCVKTSGFAYACIVLFWICLYRLAACFKTSPQRGTKRLSKAVLAALGSGYRLGGAVFLLVMVVGCAPYVTNLMHGRHIFYPLLQGSSSAGGQVDGTLEEIAEKVYPGRSNRFTRLFFSTIAYPAFDDKYPAEMKNPFGAPWLEWQLYEAIGPARAGGLGPLFYLACLLSLAYAIVLRVRGNFCWLLSTLFTMIAVQPHSWQVRYVPFMWLLPIVLLLAIRPAKEYLLSIPLFILFVDIAGVSYIYVSNYWERNQRIIDALAPYRGQYVLLDRSIFQCDGFFDRYAIKQKFANPEDTFFAGFPWAQARPQRYTGRPAFGSNIAFEEDIPLLPAAPLSLAEERANPWTVMSEGIVLYNPDYDPEGQSFISWQPFSYDVPEGWWNYSKKVKFFMQVKEKPSGDIIFALTAAPRVDEKGNIIRQAVKILANNRQLGEWLFDRPGSIEKTIALPRATLEESYNDAMHLLTLTFYLLDPDNPNGKSEFGLMFEKMEFRRNS